MVFLECLAGALGVFQVGVWLYIEKCIPNGSLRFEQTEPYHPFRGVTRTVVVKKPAEEPSGNDVGRTDAAPLTAPNTIKGSSFLELSAVVSGDPAVVPEGVSGAPVVVSENEPLDARNVNDSIGEAGAEADNKGNVIVADSENTGNTAMDSDDNVDVNDIKEGASSETSILQQPERQEIRFGEQPKLTVYSKSLAPRTQKNGGKLVLKNSTSKVEVLDWWVPALLGLVVVALVFRVLRIRGVLSVGRSVRSAGLQRGKHHLTKLCQHQEDEELAAEQGNEEEEAFLHKTKIPFDEP